MGSDGTVVIGWREQRCLVNQLGKKSVVPEEWCWFLLSNYQLHILTLWNAPHSQHKWPRYPVSRARKGAGTLLFKGPWTHVFKLFREKLLKRRVTWLSFSIFPTNMIQMAYHLVVTHLDMKSTSLHPRDIRSNGTCLVPLWILILLSVPCGYGLSLHH